MATIQTFEDLLCWQKARLLTKEVYKSLNIQKFKDLNISRDYGFCDQIQRASVSVMSNIAEGFERGTRQEFLNYLFIAKGSAGEVRAQLYVGLDAGYLNIETFKYLNSLAVECSRLLSSFIKSLKTTEFKGLQYKKEKTQAQLESEKFDDYLKEILDKSKNDI
jgi:four helix bundle protein